MQLKSAEDVNKTEHRYIQIGEHAYYIGPTFSGKENVVTVILSMVEEETVEEAIDSLRSAL